MITQPDTKKWKYRERHQSSQSEIWKEEIWHPIQQDCKKKQIIHAWHAQNNCECEVHTNNIQERHKESWWTSDRSHVQELHPFIRYEGDGGTGPGQSHKKWGHYME